MAVIICAWGFIQTFFFRKGRTRSHEIDDYEQEQEELREKLLRLNEEINEQEEQSENIDRFISKCGNILTWAN